MDKDNAIVYFCSLVSIGIIFLGVIITFLQITIAWPIIALGIFLLAIVLLVNKGKWAHKIEDLEKVFFFITFIIICILFIMHYRMI